MKKILRQYKKKKAEIQNKLESFQNLSEKEIFKEFMFCLLTPQSQAQKCWKAVEQLSKTPINNLNNITETLRSRTRFHNTKAKRILKSKETFQEILPLLRNTNILELRNLLAKKVNGYGLKESSHFLRNIGLSGNKIAIVDRHILKNLHLAGLIPEKTIKSPKHYLETEQIFLNFANSLQIPIGELDLLFWSQENGKIFK